MTALDQSVVDLLAVAGGGEQGFQGGHHPEQAFKRRAGQIVGHLEYAEQHVVLVQRDRPGPVIASRRCQLHGREPQVEGSSKVPARFVGGGLQIPCAQHHVSQVGRQFGLAAAIGAGRGSGRDAGHKVAHQGHAHQNRVDDADRVLRLHLLEENDQHGLRDQKPSRDGDRKPGRRKCPPPNQRVWTRNR